MASVAEWKRKIADIRCTEKNVVNASIDINNDISGFFTDPENYQKLLSASDSGIDGLNLAVRKHTESKEIFDKIFIERAKNYNACKSKIEIKFQEIIKQYNDAAYFAIEYGIDVEHM